MAYHKFLIGLIVILATTMGLLSFKLAKYSKVNTQKNVGLIIPTPTQTPYKVVDNNSDDNQHICRGREGTQCSGMYVKVDKDLCQSGLIVCCDLGNGQWDIRSKANCDQIHHLLAQQRLITEQRKLLAYSQYLQAMENTINNINSLKQHNIYEPSSYLNQAQERLRALPKPEPYVINLPTLNFDKYTFDAEAGKERLEASFAEDKQQMYMLCLDVVKSKFYSGNSLLTKSMMEDYENSLRDCEYYLW